MFRSATVTSSPDPLSCSMVARFIVIGWRPYWSFPAVSIQVGQVEGADLAVPVRHFRLCPGVDGGALLRGDGGGHPEEFDRLDARRDRSAAEVTGQSVCPRCDGEGEEERPCKYLVRLHRGLLSLWLLIRGSDRVWKGSPSGRNGNERGVKIR